jgi:hypothetical protein
MRDYLRAGACAAAVLGILSGGLAPSHGAGVLAIGKCAAYGYAYDYPSIAAAETAARAKCTDGSCNQVVTAQKGCAAFAVDGHKPCGPNGYANASKLGAAQNAALKSCYKYGGKDCVIRAWICDGKG